LCLLPLAFFWSFVVVLAARFKYRRDSHLVISGVGDVAGEIDHVVRRLYLAMDSAIANFPPTVVAIRYAEAALQEEVM
jgi:hypothetical protein